MGSRNKGKKQTAVQTLTKRLPDVSRGAAIVSAVTGALVFAGAYLLGRRTQ